MGLAHSEPTKYRSASTWVIGVGRRDEALVKHTLDQGLLALFLLFSIPSSSGFVIAMNTPKMSLKVVTADWYAAVRARNQLGG